MKKILIMGAAGRDFHVFNTCYRHRKDLRVVAFTAAQIPHIENRSYPSALAGPRYAEGIPIRPETELQELIGREQVDQVIFAYSDVHRDYVEDRRRLVQDAGADFAEFDVDASMIPSNRPVIAVCAVRTGCGKSQTARRIVTLLQEAGLTPVAIRHPMPYGRLEQQVVQRFAKLEDLDLQQCTIEEREEYEPYIERGAIVYAGVDYGAILARAEAEAQVIVWDGGNNDTPFYRPDLWITVADPHRPGHELEYFPGDQNFARADVILINKEATAEPGDIEMVVRHASQVNPNATIVHAASPITVDNTAAIRGKRVLAIEDGPTLTHGGMPFGAATLAARKWGAAEIVDPRPYLVGELKETFAEYPTIGPLLPAMGYGPRQVADLESTINRVDCDLVLVGTPIDLSRIIEIRQPNMRVIYELQEKGTALQDAVSVAARSKSPP